MNCSKGVIYIKIKPFNILLLVLAALVSMVVVHGVDAGVDENTIYLLDRIHEFGTSVDNERMNVENLKNEIDDKESKISYVDEDGYFNEIVDINSEMQKLKNYNGFTDVRGSGVRIRVADSLSEDETIDIMQKIVHDVDITILINDLKSAGAEAISINGQRIINISEVVCAGPLLKINGYSVSAPFLISAIGEPEALYDAINGEGTYGYELKNIWNMEVATMKSYNLYIAKLPMTFQKKYKIQYAEIAE